MAQLKQYKHIFFDFDHTLWDYEKNSSEVLQDIYLKHELQKLGVPTFEDFSFSFSHVNKGLWDDYNKSRISRDQIREQRFLKIFEQFEVSSTELSQVISEEYLMLCPTKPNLMPFTLEVLDYLSQKYELHILTNGFSDVQKIKLQHSNIASFFKTVVTSDSAGYKKPMASIFQFALDKADARKHESIMIGDNLQTDIMGARNFGMDTIFYNPFNNSHKASSTHEIDCLSQLKQLF